MKLTLREMATILNAPIQNEADVAVTSTAFDSRQVKPGGLFIPLVADNDGHHYVDAAESNGATVALWQADHQNVPSHLPIIIVPDTLAAYQQLASHYLSQVDPLVVAVSGSNGKTTTKDFIAAIGQTSYKTVKTPENFNNEIGVPQTILSMPTDTELLVIEIGMDHPGDLTFLSKLVKPDIALLTMIGEAHIEFFKTRERIADGKMEIINGLKEHGHLVFNGDEPLLLERVGQHAHLLHDSFGLNSTNDLFASEIDMTPVQASFKTNQSAQRFTIPMTGRYNVTNALSAITVGHLLHISDEKIAQALAEAPITENRTEWLDGQFGGKILSDVYNSNPTAAKEVLHFFADTPTQGKRIAVLGDMLQLGDASPALHASLMENLNPDKIAHVYLVGEEIKSLEEALLPIYPAGTVKRYAIDDPESLLKDLLADLTPDDTIMLKGSHGVHLENIVNQLKK
ncbi:UDP-N-acetylmuramoyl-tripeptide--D-alanyl-D-alanine ligase [Weissella paramesenteroides]|jgi:UDP-N-acetylmuramoyl-tripeptide--D-alanyl-D-alanine ligase|uniref:UDP-N-acetylmuramoyl-tripeptide--D-alanyl-D-alanine ligase n=1 Tax=Weissella paramesenteroides TaxID=1249 RepID=A0A4Q7IYE2_WEIPA|nr:UDP-N-acetylmuramoyl-tripeptide--D-alanyl-D-alanine ligase [Weissella paramesenteroides]KAA8439721.1 UDP-N-acetylmuramoyl-tripeptide--D-alanyl-D-alanine ligase [Weissella paramesenteroides]KAA8441609.1 UDP-N-acetylmuramoyl-tripeptide--D-alanyl-D-alanine ligase [Weissella paramesenteroides]KAA8444622.1 UDP-N-acetylmuramoyl-tripeptide--D-alanyl-D-alanine ligase [Weissella paramesenteroides]KAA8446309.1 UDP-N-acetylmuramoyl-tripeptide--D-alanyl-D-alanine ligase [Weissella paramesenteroides]KAA